MIYLIKMSALITTSAMLSEQQARLDAKILTAQKELKDLEFQVYLLKSNH